MLEQGYDAIVIGGGPAGATAALMLAREGWSVAVVEKAAFPRRKVCGEFISATSMPLLNVLGVEDAFLQMAGPEVCRVGMFAADTTTVAPIPRPYGSAVTRGRALGREHLDTLLLAAAVRAGANLWQPWSARGLRREGDVHVCEIATKDARREIAARVIIAAHGSWELGSLPTQTPIDHRESELLAFKAHFRDCDLPADLMPLLVFPGGYGGMVHSDDGRVSLSCCIRRDELARCRQRDRTQNAGEAVLHHVRRHSAGVSRALARAALDGAWLAAGPIRPGMRDRCTQGIFVIGNAAGEAHPIVAEGISMAMQSAWLLCERLLARPTDILAGRGIDEIGRDYARAWRHMFATRVRAAALFAQFAMRPNAAALFVPVLRQFPGLLTFGAQLSGKAKMLSGLT